MSKINEYPQAVTINNNDLFVIDQESGGDHATKSASVSQIADKATSGVQSQIGDLSTLTTSVKSSLVGAVNEVNKGALRIAKYSFTKSINATTEATFIVTRSDLSLPTGAKVVDAYIKQNNAVNTSNYWAYALKTSESGTNAVTGAIYNPTNSNRNYPVMATVFYTMA